MNVRREPEPKKIAQLKKASEIKITFYHSGDVILEKEGINERDIPKFLMELGEHLKEDFEKESPLIRHVNLKNRGE